MYKTLLLLLLVPFLGNAQAPEMSIKSQMDVQFIHRQIPLILKGEEVLLKELPLIQIQGEMYVSFLGKLRSSTSVGEEIEGVIVGKGSAKIRSVRIRLNELGRISELNQFEALELAGKINPHLEDEGFDTRVDSVHLGLNLPQAYSGQNVLIGVNDWGFDYTHPMFYDTTLTENRIVSVWDQFKRSGSTPANFNYGAEYNSMQEIVTAESDTMNQLGKGTHGTHVAGIAGGSGAGVSAKGMAFSSKYLFSTIQVDEASALDSWYWMQQKALAADKRLVVNMSWGLFHFGTNDGTSLISQALDDLSNQGVLFVSSAGNNGNVQFHFDRTFNNDSIKSRIEFYNYAYHDSLWGQSIHGWGEVGKNFEVKAQFKTANGVLLGETPYYSTTFNNYDAQFMVLNAVDTIWYNIAAQSVHPQNLKPTVRLRIKNKHTAIYVDLVAKAVDGKVHFWNVVELTTNGGNWGQKFIGMGPGYVAGDVKYGIGEPTCATTCISVASHIASYLHSNGVNVLGGDRSSFSSIGPRNDGAMKPDISAPGSFVTSSVSSYTTDSYTSVLSTDFQGRTYHFASFSGTSMASPVVAGICALILEINPYLSPAQVKEIVIETARQDSKTGVIPPSGSTSWGFGKIDAMAMVRTVLNYVGLENSDSDKHMWGVVPNPASSSISLYGFEHVDDVKLIDVTGKIVSFDAILDSWDVRDFPAGIYVLRVIANQRVYQQKIIIQ